MLVISDFHKPTYLPKNRISFVDAPNYLYPKWITFLFNWDWTRIYWFSKRKFFWGTWQNNLRVLKRYKLELLNQVLKELWSNIPFCNFAAPWAKYMDFCSKYLETDSKKSGQNKKLTTNKNLQSLSCHYETWSKRQSIEVVLLTKFHEDSSKIVDFLLEVNFWSSHMWDEAKMSYI